MGFFRGFLAPFRAAGILRRERLLHLAILPVVLNVALAVGAAWAAAAYWRQELAIHASTTSSGSTLLASVLLGVTTALGAIVLFVILQPVLGAVFNDALSERIERRTGGTVPRAPFVASALRATWHGVLKLILYAAALLIGLAASLATAGIGGVVGVALGVLFFAYDGFDYPLARRGAGFGAKWRYLALHPMQTIGYGLGATVLYLVPLALVVAPPLMAAGATLTFLETEARQNQRRDQRAERAQRKGKGRIDETSALRDGQG
jgi:uncharacterized protein involved in cysteine biosynthesis